MAGELKRLSRDTKLLRLKHRPTQDLAGVVLIALAAWLTAGALLWSDFSRPVDGGYYFVGPAMSLGLFTVLLSMFFNAWSVSLQRGLLIASAAVLAVAGIAFADRDDLGSVMLHYWTPAVCVLGAALSLGRWRTPFHAK